MLNGYLPTQNLLLAVSILALLKGNSLLLLFEDHPQHLFDIARFAPSNDFC